MDGKSLRTFGEMYRMAMGMMMRVISILGEGQMFYESHTPCVYCE